MRLVRLHRASKLLVLITCVLWQSLIGDAIVAWRTWVLCGRNSRVLVFPVICIIGTLGACTFSQSLYISSILNMKAHPLGLRPCSRGHGHGRRTVQLTLRPGCRLTRSIDVVHQLRHAQLCHECLRCYYDVLESLVSCLFCLVHCVWRTD